VESVDAVVVGGGCVGTSVAYHLAAAGCTDVILLEGAGLGSGSTGKAAGGIRLQHGDLLNTQLALRSLAEFSRFEQLIGVPIGFRQVGYLFLLDNAADLARFREAIATQRSIGIPSEELDVHAAHELVPQLAIDDLVAATYCPLDGYATPEAVVQGYAAAARRMGVAVRAGSRVTGIRSSQGRVTGVDTARGFIATRSVVCAAGVGSAALGATIGVDLPVRGQARRIFYSNQHGGIRDDAPLTVDFSSGFYFRREGQGLIFAGPQWELEALSAPAVHRLPLIADLPIVSSWHGDYDVSPDHNGMIGGSQVEGFYYATGFSGHGFQLSPAVGEHLAELVTGREPTIDLTALSAERFSTGVRRVEHIVI